MLPRHRVRLAATALVALALVAPARASEDEVRAAFERFQEAFLAADAETLAALLTDDYRHTNGASAPIGKREWLRWVDGRRARVDTGTLVHDVYAVEELVVSLHGDAAVVTGRARGRGRDGERDFAVDVRFTQIWVRDAGAWRRAAFQDAQVAPEASTATAP